MGNFRGFLFSLIVLTSSAAMAANLCLNSQYMVQTGYMVSTNQVRLLQKQMPLPRNVKTGTKDKITRVENHITKTWKSDDIPGITASELAKLIVNVSEKVGVDYQVLAAIVQKESGYCKFRLNKTGGDSGCMQFTGPALNEMKHQFGLAGESKHSPGAPAALNQLTQNYFSSETDARFVAFKKWWSLGIDQIKQSIRGQKNHEFDILSGGLFLKFTLALANGNYGIAVRNYNGSSKKHAYQASVMNNAAKVSWDDVEIDAACEEDFIFEMEIHKSSCELTDEPVRCFNSYLQTLPNST